MGYTDIIIRVCVDILGPLCVLLGPIVLQHPINLCGVYTGCGPALSCGQAPNSPVYYALGMPWCATRPLRMREQIGVFGYSCVNWCANSLVQGSVGVAMLCSAQHSMQHYTLQHSIHMGWTQNATTGIAYIPSVMLAPMGDIVKHGINYIVRLDI